MAVTVAIERLGGRVGGLLGTLPTTIVPASLGLWAETADLASFQQAMDATPAGMLANAIFLWLWRAVPPHLPAWSIGPKLVMMSVVSLSAWSAMALAAVGGGRAWVAGGGSTLVWGVTATALMVLFGILACLRAPPAPRGARRVGPVVLLARAAFAATAIGLTIWIASVVGPIAAGVAAVFPAMFYTAMASVWLSQGHAVPAGAVGPMMLGATSVAAYALAARWTFDAFGPVAGALTAWLVAVGLATVPAWWWLGRRRG